MKTILKCISKFFVFRFAHAPNMVVPVVFAGLFCTIQGCSTNSNRYLENYELKSLKVVFLDEDSLRDEWKLASGRETVRFSSQMNSTVPVIKTVRGFYNFATNTLYCPKWNFEVCGHELHHATLGQFHVQD